MDICDTLRSFLLRPGEGAWGTEPFEHRFCTTFCDLESSALQCERSAMSGAAVLDIERQGLLQDPVKK